MNQELKIQDAHLDRIDNNMEEGVTNAENAHE